MSQTVEELKEQLSCMSVTAKIGWTPKRSGSASEDKAFADAVQADEHYVGTYHYVIDEAMPEWRALLEAKKYVDYYWKSKSFAYVIEKQRLCYRDERKAIIAELESCGVKMKEKATLLDSKKAQIMNWGKSKFPTTFDERAYPVSWAVLVGVIRLDHEIDPPKYLEREDQKDFQRQQLQAVANVEASMRHFESQCFARMSELTYNFDSAMGKSGTHGITPAVKGMGELFDRVAQMRFEGTAAFQRCLEQMRELFDETDPDTIKRPGAAREEARRRLAEIVERNRKLKELVLERAKKKESSNEPASRGP